MTIGPGDALFGQDGTGGGIAGTEPMDDIGPLPGFDSSVRLPTVGLDGVIVGLDNFDSDIARSAVPGEPGADSRGDRAVPVTGTGPQHPIGQDDEAGSTTDPSTIAGSGPGTVEEAVGGTGSAITGSAGSTPLVPAATRDAGQPRQGIGPRSHLTGSISAESAWQAAEQSSDGPGSASGVRGPGPDPPSSPGTSAIISPSDAPAPTLDSAAPGPADAGVPPRTASVGERTDSAAQSRTVHSADADADADVAMASSGDTADRRPDAPIITRPTDHATERAPDVDAAVPDDPPRARRGPTGAGSGAVPPDRDIGTIAAARPAPPDPGTPPATAWGPGPHRSTTSTPASSTPDAAGPGAASRAPDRPATAITRPTHRPSHGPAHPRQERPAWPVVTRPVRGATVARPPFARPPAEDDDGILGFSRRARSRRGSRIFTAFFVLVFAVILIQMVIALLQP